MNVLWDVSLGLAASQPPQAQKPFSNRRLRLALMGAIATAGLAAAAPASAITIVVNDLRSARSDAPLSRTPDAVQSFRIAANYWEKVLTNDATINLNVGFGDYRDQFIIAGAEVRHKVMPIADYYAALATTGDSALDAMAVANLSPLSATGSVDVLVPGYLSDGLGIDSRGTRTAPDGLPISTTMAATTANAKALGATFSGNVDAEIRFSNRVRFDFDPSNGVGGFDFIGTAIHEIGHALGFVSGVDFLDFAEGIGGSIRVDENAWGQGLDIFRYSAPGQLDWRPRMPAYFSLDGGVTPFSGGLFPTGSSQASHWKPSDLPNPCANPLGVMDPLPCGGSVTVTALDLAAFDAIGWNLNFDVLADPGYNKTTAQIYREFFAVPEPSAWMTLILGFGLVGGVMRRRATTAA